MEDSIVDAQASLIAYLGVAPRVRREHRLDAAALNRRAVKAGYAVAPECCGVAASRWLDTLTGNPNATFYKEWGDVLEKNRLELYLDQVLHYATTYGTGFACGNGYVPNTGTHAPDFKTLRVIRAVSKSEFMRRCAGLVESGVALKPKVMQAVCDLLVEEVRRNGGAVDLSRVRNKEAQAYLAILLGRYPEDAFGILRALVFAHTGSCLLIKSKEMLENIRVTCGTRPSVAEQGWQDGLRCLKSKMEDSQSRLAEYTAFLDGTAEGMDEIRARYETDFAERRQDELVWMLTQEEVQAWARDHAACLDGSCEVEGGCFYHYEARRKMAAARDAARQAELTEAEREREFRTNIVRLQVECRKSIESGTRKVACLDANIQKERAARRAFHSPLLDLGEAELEKLASIFLRFKPIFLAMKTPATAHVVNRLRKLAVTRHRPLKTGFWENVISTPHTEAEIEAELGKVDNFRKVRVLQGIEIALRDEAAKAYILRNGKVYVRAGYKPSYDRAYLGMLRRRVRASLVASLAKKACRVKYPVDFSLAVPSSEKSFVGNFPFGTRIRFAEHNVVGIYWRNEWGTNDFDISFTDYAGRRISWCADYVYGPQPHEKPAVVYSGDMTNADPEAAELLYMRGACPDGVVRVNKFWGAPESKFRFFVANEAIPGDHMLNYMVDPSAIKLDAMVEVGAAGGEKIVGLVHGNALTLMELTSGNGRVGRATRSIGAFVKTMAGRTDCFLRLRDLLEEAGFTEDAEHPDLDLTRLAKDTILDLLR